MAEMTAFERELAGTYFRYKRTIAQLKSFESLCSSECETCRIAPFKLRARCQTLRLELISLDWDKFLPPLKHYELPQELRALFPYKDAWKSLDAEEQLKLYCESPKCVRRLARFRKLHMGNRLAAARFGAALVAKRIK